MNAKVVATTVRVKVVVAVAVPEVPVTVTVVVPVVAVGEADKAAETLHVDGDGVQVGGLGVKTAVAPVGSAERLNVTGAGVPAVVAAESVSVPAEPP